MDKKEIIIRGPLFTIPMSNESLGMKLYNALKEEREAPLFIDAFSGETVLSKTTFRNSCYLGQSLRNYGLAKDDVIAVCSGNNLRFFEPVLAGLYSGIIVSVFTAQDTIRELIHVANISQPTIIFCSTETSSKIIKIKHQLKKVPKVVVIDATFDYKGCQSMENFILENVPQNFDIGTFEPSSINVKEDVAVILHSSGTTGLPKGVMLTHFNFNTAFEIVNIAFNGVLEHQTCFIAVPLYHVYGFTMGLQRILYRERAIVMKKFDPNVYLRTIQDYKINSLPIVPSIANFLIKSPLVDNYDLTSVKIVSCGSTYLRRENEALLAKRLNVTKILQIYAMTESLGGITADFAGKAPLGSCGYPLPNMSVQIIDTTTGKSLGPMMVGELCCRSDVVMKGYFNDPEATKNTIDENGWLHTGDMAYYDSDNMFYIVDRLKELIKCKGYQVAPAELETVLINHPKIADAGVIGIPHDRHGETPLAFVVTIQGKMLKEKEVKDFVNEQVAPYKRVESVLFVPQIPRNAAGKILRRALRNKAFERKSHL